MQFLTKKRKGQISIAALSPIVITFVVVGIVIGSAFMILDQMLAQSDPNTYAYNGTLLAIEAISTIAGWLGIIAVVVAAAIVIGIVLSYFRQKGSTAI